MKRTSTLILLALIAFKTLLAQATIPLEHYKFRNASLVGENGSNTGAVSSASSNSARGGEPLETISLTGGFSHSIGNPGLSTTNGLSISFWIKPSSNVNDTQYERVLLSQGASCSLVDNFTIFTKGGVIYFRVQKSGFATTNSVSTVIDAEKWQHFVFTINKSKGTLEVYKDFVLKQSSFYIAAVLPTTFSGSEIFLTGSPCINATPNVVRFSGDLDELKFYNQTLSTLDVQEIAEPLELYEFTNGSLTGKYGTSGGLLAVGTTTNSDGVQNNAASLVGNVTSWNLGNPALNPYNGFTVSFWLKPSLIDNNTRIIFAQRGQCSGVNRMEAKITNGNVVFDVAKSGIGAVRESVSYSLNVWQNFTFVINVENLKIKAFKDGVFQSETSITQSQLPISFSGSNVTLLNNSCNGIDGTLTYNGGLDELAFFNVALPENRITSSTIITSQSITTPQSENKLDIYPNPSFGTINTKKGLIELFNLSGAKVFSEISDGTVNLSHLKKGIYIAIQNNKPQKLIIK